MTQVRIRISYEQLGKFLRLPDGTKVTGVDWEVLAGLLGTGPSRTLVLLVDMPDAPEDAVAAELTYSRRRDVPDPYALEGTLWFREDRTLIVPEAEPR